MQDLKTAILTLSEAERARGTDIQEAYHVAEKKKIRL